jgi:uncharacterized protein
MFKINKRIVRVTYVTLLFLYYHITLIAQTSSEEKIELSAKLFASEQNIYIRWIPRNFKTWELGNSKGYTIIRFTIKRNDEPLPSNEVEDSKVEIPLTVQSKDQLMEDGHRPLFIAAAAIYEPGEFEVTGFNGSPAVKAYQQEKNKDSRMNFSLLAAAQEFVFAERLALGYKDANVQPDLTYRYIIMVSNLNEDELASSLPVLVEANVEQLTNQVAAPLGVLNADIGDKMVTLKWNKPSDPSYVSFNIYRRVMGTNGAFIKRNDLPYVFTDQEKENVEIVYPDELPDNSTTFEYYIQGINDFGFIAGNSNTKQIKGRPKPIEIAPFIESATEDVNKQMALKWNFPVNLQNRISGFEVRRAQSRESDFMLLQGNIPKTATTFLDPNPLPSAYYMIVAKDINDYNITSVPKLAQLVDTEVPAPPINLRGTIDMKGNLTLKWDNNTEPDLMGYTVFISNNRDDPAYVLVTPEHIIEPQLDNHPININTLAHKIYMKVAALDFHHNRSELSLPCEILIPDIIPPANPVLDSVVCSAFGNKITWRNSFSDDVVKHQLERKATDEEEWFVIHEYPNKRDHFYLDRLTLPGKHYCYRLKAIDAAELVSYSTEYCNSCGQGGFAAAQNLVAFLDPDFIKDGTTKDPNMCEDGKPRRRKGIIKVYFEVPDASNIFDFEIMRSIGNTLGGGNDKFMVIDAPQPRNITFTGRYTIKNPDKKGKDIVIGLDDTPSNETPKADVPKAPSISTNGEPTGGSGGTGTGSTSTGGGVTGGTGSSGTNPTTLEGTISKPKPRSKRRAYLFTDKDWETLLCVRDWKKVKYKIRIRYKNGGTSEISLPIVVL